MKRRLFPRPSLDNNEPVIQVILRYRDNKTHEYVQTTIDELQIQSYDELDDLENAVFRTTNAIRDGRS